MPPDQQRAIVTRELGGFRPLLSDALRLGTPTNGLVCVPSRSSLSKKHIGRLVGALEASSSTPTPGPTPPVGAGVAANAGRRHTD